MPANRTRIWFSLFVLAVFCVGLALGVVLGRRMPSDAPQRAGMFVGPGARGGPAARAGRGGILIERLDRELQLTSDQKTRIRGIFDERRSHLETVQREIASRAEKEQQELQAEVRQVLTPDQQERFDRWLAQQRRGRRGRPAL
jgi:Spy/CpxP family protein refolding chaperone